MVHLLPVGFRTPCRVLTLDYSSQGCHLGFAITRVHLRAWKLTVRKTVHASGLGGASPLTFLCPSPVISQRLSIFDHCLTRVTPRSNFVPTLGQLVFMLPDAAVVSLPSPQSVGSVAEFRSRAPCLAIFPCACTGSLPSHSPSSLSTNEALSSRPHDPLMRSLG